MSTKDSEADNSNSDESDTQTDHYTIAERFANVLLESDRFVDVEDGKKACFKHDTRYSDPRDVPGTNYGVYTDSDGQLVVLDVDDYQGVDDRDGLKALSDLPATLKVATPHGGTHKPYAVEASDGRPVADVLEDELGVRNPTPSWGEVQVANKYVVGAGSQLDGCSKEWCDDCATDNGGRYEVSSDQAIATVDAETLVDVLAADPGVERDSGADSAAESDETPTPQPDNPRSQSDSAGERSGYGEWLNEDLASDALDHIDPDVSYPAWRNIGFALAELFRAGTAKRLFEQWSRDGSKWDDDAASLADRIISDASSGAVTPATLVYHAKQAGWEPPVGAPSIETDTRSGYYDADLPTFADDADADPWSDPDAMLRACLRARAAGAVSEFTAPPTLALLPLRRDVLNQNPNRDMADGTRSLLEDLFFDLEPDDLDDVLAE